MTATEQKFDPDWCISPGETITDWMEENGLVHGDRRLVKVLATACGHMDVKRLQKLIDGRVQLRYDDAARLESGTGIPAFLWLNLEKQFRQGLADGKRWVR